MLKYNGYSITFTNQKPSDKLDVDKIKRNYNITDVNIKREYKKIKKLQSDLSLVQQKAVVYLYQHLYIYNI